MGKYIKDREESEVLQVVGGRMNGRAISPGPDSSTPRKKRKVVEGGEFETIVQLKSRMENWDNLAVANDENSVVPSFDHVPPSCCSSNGSPQVYSQNFNPIDLVEVKLDINTSGDRSETMSQNEGGSEEQVTKAAELTTPPESPRAVKSPAKLPPPLSRTKPRPPVDSGVQRPPPQQIDIADLERFFAAGFQKMEQDFTEKYNFDFANDKPLEGRYEWVILKD